MLQYGVSEGYAPLIEELKKLARDRYDAFSENDAVIVTSGAQQVMSLMSQAFLNHGDCVICEERRSSARSTATEASRPPLRRAR